MNLAVLTVLPRGLGLLFSLLLDERCRRALAVWLRLMAVLGVSEGRRLRAAGAP